MFLGNLGAGEIVVVLLVALLIFGPKKLPELGRTLGKGIREFRRGTSGLMSSLEEADKPAPRPTEQPARLAQAEPAETKPAETKPEKTVIDLEKEGSDTP